MRHKVKVCEDDPSDSEPDQIKHLELLNQKALDSNNDTPEKQDFDEPVQIIGSFKTLTKKIEYHN